MFANVYGVRRLGDPAFRRLVIVLVAGILFLFRLTQFAVFTTQIQWGYDFSAYWAAAGYLIQGSAIYAADQLSGLYAPQRQFLYLYPPPLAAAFMPLAALVPADYRLAMWAWAAIDAAILAAGTVAVARSIGLFDRIRAATGLGPWILLVAVFAFPPVVGELVLGNVHILLFGLLAVAWLGIRQGDRNGERLAGLAVGIAAVIKVFPALIVVWFLLTGRRRSASWFLVGVVGSILVTLPFTGIGPWLDFPAALLNLSAPSDTTDTLAPTVWLSGLIGFTLARIVVTGTAVGLLAWFSRRLSSRRGFVLAVLLSVLVAPALYHHYLAILVLPFLLLLMEDGALPWLALAYLLMSGGEQTALGGLSWVVNRGMPTAGALVLVGVAVFGTRRQGVMKQATASQGSPPG